MSLWKYIYICAYVCINCVPPPAYLCMCMETSYTCLKSMYVCVSMCVYSFAHTYAVPDPQIKAWVGQSPCVVETGLFGKANERAALSIVSMWSMLLLGGFVGMPPGKF